MGCVMRMFLGSIVLLAASVALAAPPEIKVPKKVEGAANDFIPVVVETEGKEVKFVAVTPGLKVFPSGLMSNKKATVVFAPVEGEYKLLCYTGKGDEVTDPVYVTVVVGEGGGGEVEPKVDPIAKDPLYAVVKDAYKGLKTEDKAKKKSLSAVYKVLADSLNGVDTAGALFTLIKDSSDARVGAEGLRPLRDIFGGELEPILPKIPNQVLSADEKTSVSKQLRRFASILDHLK